ncbi:YafY family protein [Frigidibacter sp. RF13]|uniref:helix-turn-helix transcriptional regulator n=1 Tax=Frigidibacter sp. RF13 TaxID=2997340 RepID=UPI0022717B49|nr:YafY family protein [Frigidibacter sp. RF13]MCY1126923.1 YafY family protein [Frigidibacter sp. RF13]
MKPIRMLDLIALLRGRRRPLTAAEIAERLGASRRTVYRDIAGLQAMGVPIDGAAGVGYILRPGFDLPPLNFTAEEVEAIVVALALLPRTGDRGLVAAAEGVAAKIAASVPRQASATLAASGWHGLPEAGTDPALLRRAIRDERRIAFHYRNAEGEESDRSALPLALVYYIDSTVLAAFCELRQDFRHFRLDRMSDCHFPGGGFRGRGRALRADWSARTGAPAPA